MIRILKHILLFLTISFILLNSVAFLVLNSPIIQHAVINYINTSYLKPKNLKLNLNSLSVNFFSAALNLNEVNINNINNNDENNFKFSLNQITLTFDVPLSYFYRKAIVKKIMLRGMELNLNYNEKGELLLPNFIQKTRIPDNEKINLLSAFSKFFPELPERIEILNGILALGVPENKKYQYININLLKLNKLNSDKIYGLNFQSNINGTLLKFPMFNSDIKINQFNLDGNIWQNGKIIIKEIDLNSNIFKLNASMNSQLNSNLIKSNYEININSSNIISDHFFSLFKLKSNGNLFLTGKIQSSEFLDSWPSFIGNLNWNNLYFDNISAYSGSSDILLKNKIISYKFGKIHFPKIGTLFSQGQFNLYDEFNFHTESKVESLSFSQLMNGFGVKSSPVEFNLQSKNLIIDGKIKSKDIKKQYELFITANIAENGLKVVTFEQTNRKPISNFNLDLKLNADSTGLYFDKTNFILPNTKELSPSNIYISNGYINFSNPRGLDARFDLKGNNFDLLNIEYFLKMPSSGISNFDAIVQVKPPSKEVIFRSNMTISNGEFVGLKFNKIQGKLDINSKGIRTSDVNVKLSSTNLFFKFLDLDFENLKISTQGKAIGNLNGLMSASSRWLNSYFNNTSGSIHKFSFALDGLLLHPSSWNLNALFNLSNIKILNGGIDKLDSVLNCKNGTCTKSYIALNSIYSHSDQLTQHGQALLQFDNFSSYNSAFKSKISEFPIGFFDIDHSLGINGVLNSNIELGGTWKNISGFASAKFNNLNIGKLNLGNMTLTISPDSNKNLNFKLDAFHDEVLSTLSINPKENEESKFSVQFKKFNLGQFLKEGSSAKNNIFSNLNAQLNLKGNFNSNIFKSPINFFSKWNGSAELSQSEIQYDRLILKIIETNPILIANNIITIPNTKFNSDFIHLQTNGIFDLSSNKINLPINFNVDFFHLKNSFPDIFDTPSEGSATGSVLISGLSNNLIYNGAINIASKEITFKNYPPSLTNINGLINFKDHSIEIQKINAKKGKGEINIAGNINLTDNHPDLNIRFNSSKADFRIFLPIFLFADINLDSDITLTGSAKPYLVNGDINILKFHILRDLSCNQIFAQALEIPTRDQTLSSDVFANLDLNIKAINTINIESQCLHGRFSTEPTINLTGTDTTPSMNGILSADSGTLQFLKTSFDVKKAQFQFIDVQKYDPNVDIQMQGHMNNYNIYWKMNGRLSQARLDLSADPSLLPNGDKITEADIIYIMSYGQTPSQSSSANILSAYSGVSSFLGVTNFFETTLNQTVNTLTVGLIDNFSVSPSTQNGQFSWRANASRSLSKRFNLGVIYENGILGTTQSGYANYMFNNTVSAVSSINATNYVQQTPTQEIFSGLRFQFGSK